MLTCRPLRTYGLVFGLMVLIGTTAPCGRAAPADTLRVPVVEAVHFAGDVVFSDEVLRRQVRTAPNRRLLGIPGLTWWRWLYQLGETLGGGVGRAFQRIGEAPATLDRTVLAADAERLRVFYRREGFREAQVTTEVHPEDDSTRVEVVFRIDPGPPLYARQVRYEGLGSLSAAQRRRLVQHSLFGAPHTDTLAFRADGRRYSETRLVNERQRLLTFLHDAGYAAVTRDSIRALIFPEKTPGAAADSFDVVFRIHTGPRYRFGEVHFEVTGPEEEAAPRRDTLIRAPGGLVTAQIRDERRLDMGLLRRALRFQPGAWYDQSKLLATKRQLESTGVFVFSDIQSLPAETTVTGVPYLAHHIALRARRRHRIRLEAFALQRRDAFVDEVGTGLGVTYENANLLGGGEALRVRLAGSVAADLGGLTEAPDSALFSSAQLEINTSLTYPYLIWPFTELEEALGLYDARTQLSLDLLTARRDELRLFIRGRGTARLRLALQHTPTITSLVDVIDLSLSNPDTLKGFREEFLIEILGPPDDPRIVDPIQRAQITEDYTRPQINSALRYTFLASNVSPMRRRDGYHYEASFEVGNTLPALLDALVFSPDTVENSLPGLSGRLIYRPYVRMVVDLRQYESLGAGTVLAGKFVGGWAHPTGPPDLVPFDRRFYSGGATSVRGWELRALRPRPPAGAIGRGEPNLLGGDIKLEASLELRQRLLSGLLSADWIGVLFTDVGNVWFGPRNPGPAAGHFRFGTFYKELAVGTGIGLRTAWEFLILRFDLAFKVHDPLRPGSGLFPDGLHSPRLHFGIGHTF